MRKTSLFGLLSGLFIWMILLSQVVHASKNKTKYLLPPRGSYGIGYQDIFLTNTDLCPDVFYQKGVNETDFTASNTQFCHEIALRIYYPSQLKIAPGDPYYSPYLQVEHEWLKKKCQLSKKESDALNTLLKIQTYTVAHAKPVQDKKFPLVIFMPGSGISIQGYNNFVSDLVSHGYVVLGINSLFINGGIALGNGHIVNPPAAYSDAEARKENIADLKFVFQHLKSILSDFNNSIDFTRIGLIGHSRGAMSIVNLYKQGWNFENVKTLLLMDPGDLLKKINYPIPQFNIPAMTIWSSQFKKDMEGSVLLGKDHYEVILQPQNGSSDFSNHHNFYDASTLRYHPSCQISCLQDVCNEKGDGYEIALAINNYSLVFLNSYLKDDVNPTFIQCENSNFDYILKCGNSRLRNKS